MIGRFAPRGRREPEPQEMEGAPVRREPLPLARAVLWKPLPDSYHLLASMMRSTEQQTLLFITQRAFLQVERHLCSAPELELGGFLGGQLCECPRTHRRYSIVNTVVPFADVSGDPIGSRVTPEAYDRVQKRLVAHGLSVIGWYRNTSGLGLQLLPDDVETHVDYFNEPWQTTMLVVPNASRPKGAFFTYDPRVGRGYCIPFYELFDEHAAEANRLARTCVGWTTYVASAPVEPLAEAEREIVETIVAPIRPPAPEPESREPIDEWWDAIKEPWVRLKDVAVSTARRDDRDPPVAELPRESHPVARQSPVERKAPPAVRIAPKPERQRLTPPPVAPPNSEPRRPSESTGENTAEVPRTVYEDAILHVQRKLAEIESLDARATGRRRWWRRGGFGLVVSIVAFLAVFTLATARSRPSRNAQAAIRATVSTERGPALALENSPGSPGDVSLGSAVDSLSDALAQYREIANSRRKGLVSCGVLTRAHRRVERARASVDTARRQLPGDVTDADSIRVSMLGAEYTFVSQTHHRSGCSS